VVYGQPRTISRLDYQMTKRCRSTDRPDIFPLPTAVTPVRRIKPLFAEAMVTYMRIQNGQFYVDILGNFRQHRPRHGQARLQTGSATRTISICRQPTLRSSNDGKSSTEGKLTCCALTQSWEETKPSCLDGLPNVPTRHGRKTTGVSLSQR